MTERVAAHRARQRAADAARGHAERASWLVRGRGPAGEHSTSDPAIEAHALTSIAISLSIFASYVVELEGDEIGLRR